DDRCPWLQFPYHLEFFAQAVVFYRGKRDKVLTVSVGGFKWRLRQGALGHFAHDPLALTDADKLALFGRCGNGKAHEKAHCWTTCYDVPEDFRVISGDATQQRIN